MSKLIVPIVFIIIIAVALGAYFSIGGDKGSDVKNNIENMNTSNPTSLIDESEILSGGPGKDGIPSIDNPKFVNSNDADFLNSDDIGLGLIVGSEVRFYPYQILVWHEIVNDVIDGVPVAVTYCPLCRTGVVYDRRVNGEILEFGVSGKLWQSNLLMYDRRADSRQAAHTESLWSQVLGTAVVGPKTGANLSIVRSDTVKFGDWKAKHPDTKVLSQKTGSLRAYGRDPYEGYYESEEVSFGASFSDARLHPKEFVLGVEIGGKFKAYPLSALPVGITNDTLGDTNLIVGKGDIDEVRITNKDTGEEVPYIGGFWFSWLAVHPSTELYEAR